MENLIPELEENFCMQISEYLPHRNVWHLKTSAGSLCLKKVNYSAQDAVFIWMATENLYKNGFTRFNRFLTSKDGKPYFQKEGIVYTLTDWMSGNESSYTDSGELTIAASTLAELHLASQGFEPPEFGRQRIKWGYWIDNFQERLEELKKFKIQAKAKESFFDKLYFIHADFHIQQGEQALALLRDSSYEELVQREAPLQGFCHHDYAHHNVIIKDSQGYLIDFDYLICDLRCHDIASLMLRAIKDNDWKIEYGAQALHDYSDRVSLHPGEKKVMYGFLTFPQDFWQAGYTYYVEGNRSRERMDKKIKSCLTAKEARHKCLLELAELLDER